MKERKTERKKERKKQRNKQRKKDEEAIALGTTLEQSFAIGPEAGGAEKGGGHCKWARTNRDGHAWRIATGRTYMLSKQSSSHTHN